MRCCALPFTRNMRREIAATARGKSDSVVSTRRIGRTSQEDAMAKGKDKGSKETKKPKSDKPKGGGSAYQQGKK